MTSTRTCVVFWNTCKFVLVPDLVLVRLQAVDYKYDVSEIMDTWTRQMGFPVVTVTHVQGSTYHVTQERFLLNPNDTYDPDDSTYG